MKQKKNQIKIYILVYYIKAKKAQTKLANLLNLSQFSAFLADIITDVCWPKSAGLGIFVTPQLLGWAVLVSILGTIISDGCEALFPEVIGKEAEF